jgi:hypothetical protein
MLSENPLHYDLTDENTTLKRNMSATAPGILLSLN